MQLHDDTPVGSKGRKGTGDEECGVGKGEVLSTRREPMSAEIRRLEAELRRERLHNKLLNSMIDIAEEQMGVSIRKKHGAKPRSCWGNSH